MPPRLMYPTEPYFAAPIRVRLEAGGDQARQDEKGRYLRSLVELLGGAAGLAFLHEASFLRLFLNAQLRKGTALTFHELAAIAKPDKPLERFAEQLSRLVWDGLLLRGFRMECPRCGLTDRYELAALSEGVTCSGCRALLQPPLDHLEFAYRPNELLRKSLVNGATTVLLTLSALARSCVGNFMWDAAWRLGEEIELDLVCLCDEKLVICECKDSLAKETLKPQLEKTIAAATRLNADLFLLATLAEELPPTLVEFLEEADQREAQLKIGWLNRDDLLRGDISLARFHK